jgi:hypothetical protein
MSIDLYPDSLDEGVLIFVLNKVEKGSISQYSSVLSAIFTALPMSLYDYQVIG